MRVISRSLNAPRLSLPPTVRTVLDSAASEAAVSQEAADPKPSAVVHGWVRSVRAHKNVAFAEVEDGSGQGVQAVLKGKGRADGITLGSSVRLDGTLAPSRGAGQALELVVNKASILGECDTDAYPIQKKALPPPVLREHAHLRFRTGQTAAIMRVRDALARDWHDWFEDHEFIHVHTPLLTSSDCEGAGEVFTVAQSLAVDPPAPPADPSSTTAAPKSPPAFFPRPVNLTVSGQLHLEAPTLALTRAYTLSPCFRAEPSQTSRHLAEFYMLEAEVAFVQSLPALLDVVEKGVRDTLTSLLNNPTHRATRTRADLAKIAALAYTEDGEPTPSTLDHLTATATTPFARITYTDAIALLRAQHAHSPFEREPSWGEGLSSEHEKWLAGDHFRGPTFVTDYPASQKPFYMLPSDAAAERVPSQHTPEGQTVAAFDLLFPGIGEMAGGSLREHRLGELLAAIHAAGLREEDYQWYLDLRRFGTVPHGGWGMGWERWVCWVTGVGNVRDVVAFPRWAGSCRF